MRAMAVFSLWLAALAIVQGTKLQGPSEDAVNALRKKMEIVGERVKGLYSQKGPLAKTKIVDRLEAWHEKFEKKVHSKGSLAMQFQLLSEAEASVQDLSKAIEEEKDHLATEGTLQQESLLLGVLMTRKKEPFLDQLKVLVSKDFSGLPQNDILSYIQAQGDFKTPVVEQVAKYFDAHREHQEASAPTPKQDAQDPQKEKPTTDLALDQDQEKASAPAPKQGARNRQKEMPVTDLAVYPDQEKATASAPKQDARLLAGNLRKLLHKQREAAKLRKAEIEKNIGTIATAAKNHQQEALDLAKKFTYLQHMEQKKLAREVAMEQKQETALANAAAAIEASDQDAAHKAQLDLQGILDEQMGRGKFLVLLDLVGSSKSRDCPYCVGQCMEKCHAGGTTYVACLTTCADAKESE